MKGGIDRGIFDVDADISFVAIKQIPALFFSATAVVETRNYLLYSLLYAPTDGNMGVAKMPPLWNPLTPVQATTVVAIAQ